MTTANTSTHNGKRDQAQSSMKHGAHRLFITRNDLSEAVRLRSIGVLNPLLADTLDLYSQTKQAHWNVKGEEFYQLHKLFDELAESTEAFVDLIAERVTALGGEARGTVRMAAEGSRLPEFPTELSNGLQHVAALAERYGQYAAAVREGAVLTQEDDLATSDLLTEIQRTIDKELWFLDAHLQSR